MNELFDIVSSKLDRQTVDRIAGQLGSEPGGTRNAIESVLPLLVAGLNRNARSGGGDALQQALERDHDGSILDDLSGFLSNGPGERDNRIADHIFGARRGAIESQVGRASGLDSASIGQLMATLAPLVMGALARQRQQTQTSSGLEGLLGILGSADQSARSSAGGASLANLLDSDNDGDTDLADLTRLGGDLLGKFMR